MASPFSLFRKNQKTLMVVLTVLAMFAFVLLGNADPNAPGSSLVFAVMAICAVAGIGWGLGYRQGKGTDYATTGAVAALAGIVAVWFFAGPEPYVTTAEGNISRNQFETLRARRMLANDFVQRLYVAAFPYPAELPPETEKLLENFPDENQKEMLRAQLLQPQINEWQRGLAGIQFDFGRGSRDLNRDIVFGYLMGKEADRLGVEISDQAVSDFLKSMRTQVRKETYMGILAEMGVAETEMYDALREEIRASEAFRLLLPPTYTTPDEYWDIYKRLTVSQKLVATAVPVSAFVDEVEEPSEDELNVLFDQFQDKTPNAENAGDPGFLQPSKVRLGYVSIDTSKFEKSVTPPTEAEMLAYYEANKDILFLKSDFPDDEFGPAPAGTEFSPSDFSGEETPTDEPSDEGKPAGEEKPEDSEQPEDSEKPDGGEKPEGGETPTKTPDSDGKTETPAPAGEEGEKPAEPKPNEPAPAEKESEADPAESDEQSARPTNSGATLLSVSDDPAETSDPKPKAEAESEAPADPPAEEPKGDEKPTTPADPDSKPPKGDEPLDVELVKPDDTEEPREPVDPPAGDEPAEPEEKKPEYKPFDEVRETIEKTLTGQRADAAVEAAVQETFDFMRSLGLDYARLSLDQEGVITDRELKKRVSKFAKDRGFVYLETELMSYRELQESSDYEIGSAIATDGGPRGGSVVDQFFQGISEFLVSPVQARSSVRIGLNEQEAFGDYRYVVWKLAGVPSHRPLLKSFDLTASAKLDDLADELGFDEGDRVKLFPRRGQLNTVGEYFEKSVGGEPKEGDAVDVGQFRLIAKKGGGFQLYEPGVKDEVTEAWKRQRARRLAEERADELAELAKEKPATEMALVFEDQTLSGKKDGQKLEVRTTGQFSWYERSTVPQSRFEQPQPPRLGTVSGIPNVGESFMREVFEGLGNSEIGVVPDFDLSNYYVVKVIERDPENPVAIESQLEEFMDVVRDEGNPTTGGDYVTLAGAERNLVNATWFQKIEQDRYNVRYNTAFPDP